MLECRLSAFGRHKRKLYAVNQQFGHVAEAVYLFFHKIRTDAVSVHKGFSQWFFCTVFLFRAEYGKHFLIVCQKLAAQLIALRPVETTFQTIRIRNEGMTVPSIFICSQRLTFETVTVQVSLNVVTFNLFGFIFGFVMGNPVIAVEHAGHGLGGEVHLKLAGQPKIGLTFRCLAFIAQHIRFLGRQSPVPIARLRITQLGKLLFFLGIGYIIPSAFVNRLAHRQSLGRIAAFVEKVAVRAGKGDIVFEIDFIGTVAVDIARADILEIRVSFHTAFAVARCDGFVQRTLIHRKNLILLGKLTRLTLT